MKIVVLALAFSAHAASSQVVADYQLRMVGSNVYDFSAVMQPVQREEAKQTVFLVTGRGFKAGVDWAEIIR